MSVSNTTSRRAAEISSAKSSVDSEGSNESFESGADRDREDEKCFAVSGSVEGVKKEIGRIAVLKNAETDLVR